jgi:hypothetical protein
LITARARRTAGDGRGWLSESAFDERSVIGFKSSEAGFEQVALWHHHDVEAWRDLVTPENLSYQSFGPVSLHRGTEFLCRRDAKPPDALLVLEDEEREVPAVGARAAIVNLLEFGPPANPFGRPKSSRHSLLTVSRFLPLARRRFSTKRPFFVLIRTRKPCVRLRRRLFGWNVRFPFIDRSANP